MAETVLSEFGQDIDTYTLVAAAGGVHDYEIDGELVFSKKKIGRQPTADEIVTLVRERLDRPR